MKWKRRNYTSENSPYWEWFYGRAYKDKDGKSLEPAEANPDRIDANVPVPSGSLRAKELRKQRIYALIERMESEGLLDNLTVVQRRIFKMVFKGGFSFREVANKLHMTHQGAHKICHQALKKVKKFASKYVDDGHIQGL